MRAVLDTNVLISGLLWRGAPYECLLSAEGRLYELIFADEILYELRDKLVNKFRIPIEEVEESIHRIRSCGQLVQIRGQSGWVNDDPDDDKIIEAAIVASAIAIVSGDRHLLELGSIEGIEILTARQFLQRLVSE